MPNARRPLLILVIFALLAILVAGLAIRFWPSGAARPTIQRVILLSIDTLRTDALPFHGNPRIKAPVLSAIAEESIRFDRAWATSPWTRPSVVSFLTGLSPGVHGVNSSSLEVESVLPDAVPTLAECMATAGYRTAAIGFNGFIANSGNVRRGFDDFWLYPRPTDDETPSAAAAGQDGSSAPAPLVAGKTDDEVNREINWFNSTRVVTQLARHWITEHQNDAFFLWIHYFDPHMPYRPPPHALARIPDNGRPKNKTHAEWLDFVNYGVFYLMALDRNERAGRIDAKGKEALAKLMPVVRKRRKAVRALYEAEVEYVDESIGRVVELLKQLDLWEGTLLIVTSDHGEEFFEHGGFEHGHDLHEELLRVPLLIKPPGPAAPRVVRERVSNQSIFPTVLELCDIPRPPLRDEAPSLAPLWTEDRSVERPPYLAASSILYGKPGVALVFNDHKYVFRPESGDEKLYDLAADPTESTPLGAEAADILRQARDYYENWNRRRIALRKAIWHQGIRTTGQDEKTRKLLRSLGYIK